MTIFNDEKVVAQDGVTSTSSDGIEAGDSSTLAARSANLHRSLKASQVQLYGIGAAIGTGVFVSMGSYLPNGGPAGLFLGFLSWCIVGYAVSECYGEMVCHAPVPAPFIRLAAEWVDEALGFALAWAFFFNQVSLIPFEMTALQRLIGFWDSESKMPVEATTIILLVLYGLLNCISAKHFGAAEFYLSLGKVFLIFLTFAFTFITMLGGNPLHDRYGFRYWQTPGAFAGYILEGSAGHFLGYLSCVTLAAFTVCGPEYIAMVAAETRQPRTVLPAAYRSFKFRLLFFFCGAALAMGIVIPYDDRTLNAILNGDIAGSGTSRASPYVIAMERLNIPGLANFFNAVVITSVFSAGNGYVFSSSRVLYSMALERRVPSVFARTTRNGIPIYAVCTCLLFGLLTLLAMSDNTAVVMGYFIDLVTMNQLL